jgi:hypothetical protein
MTNIQVSSFLHITFEIKTAEGFMKVEGTPYTAKAQYRKFERNCAATVPIPTFMFLWAIFIFPWLPNDQTWEYILYIALGHINVKFVAEAVQFLFWEYINPNFFAWY